jgi:cell division protein ZipA
VDASTLRWTIVVIGVLILAAIFLFGNPEKKRSPKASRRKAKAAAERLEPTLEDDPGLSAALPEPQLTGQGELPINRDVPSVPRAPRKPAGPPPEKIITLFLLAPGNARISGADLLQAALKTEMVMGDMDIFHRHAEGSDQPILSMANAVKPGTFDKDSWNTFETAGLVLFMTLPGPILALDAWDMLLATAKRMAEILHAELHDDTHQPLIRQKEARIREEMRSYDRGRARKTFV